MDVGGADKRVGMVLPQGIPKGAVISIDHDTQKDDQSLYYTY